MYLHNGSFKTHGIRQQSYMSIIDLDTNKDIHRLNKAFPYEAILWARVQYHWDDQKDNYIINLQSAVHDKVLKAQLETTNLLSDLLVATNKRYGDKIKRYIQTGDEKELEGVMAVDSINGLLKLTEGLLKATGQDRVVKSITENKHTTEVNVNVGAQTGNSLGSEDAAKVLAIIADARRRSEKK